MDKVLLPELLPNDYKCRPTKRTANNGRFMLEAGRTRRENKAQGELPSKRSAISCIRKILTQVTLKDLRDQETDYYSYLHKS